MAADKETKLKGLISCCHDCALTAALFFFCPEGGTIGKLTLSGYNREKNL